MNLAEVKKALKEEIAKIEADDRYRAKSALVQVNAPLALIQVDLGARRQAYKNVLTMLLTVKS